MCKIEFNRCNPEEPYDLRDRSMPSFDFDLDYLERNIGRFIGGGFFSMVFEDYEDEDKAVVLSLEENKSKFLKNLLGEHKITTCENVYSEYINDVFVMPKMKKNVIDLNFDYPLLKASQEINLNFNRIDELSTKDVIDSLLGNIEPSLRNGKEIDEICLAIEESILALKKTFYPDERVRLDLKKEQFLRDSNGKLYCVDPVFFE